MNQKTIDLLEFPRVRARLASFCGFSLSKQLAEALEPSADPILVARWLALTTEAVRVLNVSPNLNTGGARDVRPGVERARRGGTLDPQELLGIQGTIAGARVVRGTVLRLEGIAPGLADLARLMRDYPSLEAEIGRCLSDSGDVLDSASPELAKIRSEIRVAHQRLLDKLHEIVYGGAYSKVLQEPLITTREGRYVVPVRSDSRGQLRGLIHDQSASGQTVYVEPMATVELNNRWRQLQIEEQHEIDRILRALSEQVAVNADGLDATIESLAEIDLQLAKARLAEAQNAVEPILETRVGETGQRGLRLVNARHPLLTGKVVPITIRLGNEFNVMVITGPNTGGKTVALKTAGLLTLMAQAGLHLPAEDGSQVHVFDDVLADIGDEQSIEQSLSTFSSHMRNVVQIVRQASPNTLALLDEVGAGTDPAEGSALARAILRRLLERGAWAIATTHYTELKAFAHDTEGMTNASVEFDPETLAPTYRLQIGLPGKSNALAIAARLGLEPEVLAEANQYVDQGQLQVESLLAGIQAERNRAEEILGEANAQRREAERLRAELEHRLKNLERERRDVLRQAHREAEAELAEVRAQLRRAAQTLQREGRSRTEVLEVSRQIEAAGQQIAGKPPRGTAVVELPTLPRAPERETLAVGDRVRVLSLGQEGRVAALLDDQVEVQAGAFKLRVGVHDVEPVGGGGPPPSEPARHGPSMYAFAPRPMPPSQLDMRGWRAEQVVPELEQYLNDAYACSMRAVRIVHGKGTGVLRQIVRDYLARSPLVDRFETADAREGGEGATVAYLAV
jgi:DNA mismatch repair protein MutS2